MSAIDAITVSVFLSSMHYECGGLYVCGLTAMVQVRWRQLLSPYGGLGAVDALMTVETRPYGIVKAMSFRMSFRADAIGESRHCPPLADEMLCVNAGA